jgi:hypothetical protein
MSTKSILTHGLGIVAALTFAGVVEAQEWKAKYPELVMAAAPVENPTGFVDRYTPFKGPAMGPSAGGAPSGTRWCCGWPRRAW